MKILIAVALATSILAGCVAMPEANDVQSVQAAQTSAAEIAADLATLEGKEWSGSLSYLDYSKGTREAIAVSLKFEPVAETSIAFAIKYPGEAQYNSRENYKWSEDGCRLNDAEIVSRTILPGGAVEIVTESEGIDDRRMAHIRTTYAISSEQFLVRKDVKFSEDDTFFNRNEYALSR
jgi:hypothetical protein